MHNTAAAVLRSSALHFRSRAALRHPVACVRRFRGYRQIDIAQLSTYARSRTWARSRSRATSFYAQTTHPGRRRGSTPCAAAPSPNFVEIGSEGSGATWIFYVERRLRSVHRRRSLNSMTRNKAGEDPLPLRLPDLHIQRAFVCPSSRVRLRAPSYWLSPQVPEENAERDFAHYANPVLVSKVCIYTFDSITSTPYDSEYLQSEPNMWNTVVHSPGASRAPRAMLSQLLITTPGMQIKMHAETLHVNQKGSFGAKIDSNKNDML
ncbi:hypothetical protein EVAR_45413_1 [Eumeta japonica]|uniref:Uncharacterized protein n=1 Tax=Eumeta variegata TaxID=151549 RepID=A0A4C1WRS0_EUMVA|nr:hypothetical protein EVAR_45413_1 [Eumeta japonica]